MAQFQLSTGNYTRKTSGLIALILVMLPVEIVMAGNHILIYTKNSKGYVHDNIAASVECLMGICKQNNWTCEVSDDPKIFTVEKIKQFDVLVLPNLYGDIVSDLCAGIVGGLGVAPGANLGDKLAIFEPTHGSAPKYAGHNKVNPMATMLSGVMMLRYLGEIKAADRLEKAIARVIAEGKKVTYDMKPGAPSSQVVGTSQVADAVIEKLK